MINKSYLVKIKDYLWEIPKSFRKDMRVPARIYMNEKMLEQISKDKTIHFDDREIAREILRDLSVLTSISKSAII